MPDIYEQFKAKVYKKTSINLSSYKETQMKRRITSLASRNGFNDLLEYFNMIDKDKEKFDEFINFLTINVSEFFRNPEQWKLVQDQLLPNLMKNTKELKIH